jgi:hypothetical protein
VFVSSQTPAEFPSQTPAKFYVLIRFPHFQP